jgi:hypothetical protein
VEALASAKDVERDVDADRARDVGAPVLRVLVAGLVEDVVLARIATGRTTHFEKKEERQMPRGDGTGPAGMGPMTGRGAGFCAGYGAPGFANAPRGGRGYGMGYGYGRGFGPGFGRGLGFGRGWGRGFGWQAWGRPYWGSAPTYLAAGPAWTPQAAPWGNPWGAAEISREEELGYLREQAAALKGELDAISQRVSELESEPEGGR